MDEIPSAKFRKQYAKLTKPTVVTVNGHPIGVWTPRGEIAGRALRGVTKWGGNIGKTIAEGMKTTTPTVQAARDDLLRKINRGK